MYKYLTHGSTLKNVDIIKSLLVSYNNTKYSCINKTLNEVGKNNEHDYLYLDLVRTLKYKCTFEQGYKPNCSREIFNVASVPSTNTTRYQSIDLNDDEFEGSFCAQEFQRIETGQNTFYKNQYPGSGSSFKLFSPGKVTRRLSIRGYLPHT
ncbi:hypothetical protein B566_EDAN015406 [Ephemera danica]|nr:hypothetical protein B566_EDAN015406 [Ephemera danica]